MDRAISDRLRVVLWSVVRRVLSALHGGAVVSEMRDAALSYARQGWWVFPVAGKGEHLLKNGHLDASADEMVVDAWWTKYPDANIGLWIRRSRLIVVDVDVHRGKRGREQVAALEKKYVALPRDCNQRSASGGEHVVMLDPWGDPTSKSRLTKHLDEHDHVDIKFNGYILLAPSVTSDGTYEWISEGAPPPMPKRWVDALESATKAKELGDGDVEAWAKSQDTGFDRKKLPAMLRELAKASGTGRSTTLQAVTLVFEKAGLSIAEGTPILDEHYNRRRVKPYEARALDRQIERVGDREAGRGARMKITIKAKVAPTKTLKRTNEGVSATPAAVGRFQVIRMNEVVREKIEWLWHKRVPLRSLTLFDGDPGLGKSTVIADLAARVSTGRPMPNDMVGRPPASVIIFTAEDHLASVLGPRLDASGADSSLVHVVKGVVTDADGAIDQAGLPTNLDALRELIVETGALLVAVDPIIAYLDEHINSHSDQEMRRQIFAPLATLAEETKVAIIGLRHIRKAGGTAKHRGGGTIAFTGAARAAHFFGVDPDDPNAVVIACSKTNHGRVPVALRYRVDGPEDGIGHIVWMGEAPDVTADQLAGHEKHESTKTEDASEWLQEFLSDGAKDSRDVKVASEARGYGERPLRDAAEKVGVVKRRIGKAGPDQVSMWSLPTKDGAK